jgi:hypothetical protein
MLRSGMNWKRLDAGAIFHFALPREILGSAALIIARETPRRKFGPRTPSARFGVNDYGV